MAQQIQDDNGVTVVQDDVGHILFVDNNGAVWGDAPAAPSSPTGVLGFAESEW